MDTWSRAWPAGDVDAITALYAVDAVFYSRLTSVDDSVETIAGTSLLRFCEDGLVIEQRDVWAAVPGRRDLSDWAR